MHNSLTSSCTSSLRSLSLSRSNSQLSNCAMDGNRGFLRGLKKVLASGDSTVKAPVKFPKIRVSSTTTTRGSDHSGRTQSTTNRSRMQTSSPQPQGNSEMDPPPAYTPRANPHASVPAPTQVATHRPADDPYAFLTTFDTVFLIDDSGSMAGRNWQETGQALEAITPICVAHDSDGIDIYFLNEPDKPFYKNIQQASTVREIFQTTRPRGCTPTGQRLSQILKPYLARLTQDLEGTKPLNIIVITDGEPSDDVESPIISAARKLDKLDAPAWQVGIQFFQVGREPSARAHLQQLDSGLAEIAGDDELRDMVDTLPWTGEAGTQLTAEGILKVVLGAVNRRLDRRASADLYQKRR